MDNPTTLSKSSVSSTVTQFSKHLAEKLNIDVLSKKATLTLSNNTEYTSSSFSITSDDITFAMSPTPMKEFFYDLTWSGSIGYKAIISRKNSDDEPP